MLSDDICPPQPSPLALPDELLRLAGDAVDVMRA